MLGLPAWEQELFLSFQGIHANGLNQAMQFFSGIFIWPPVIAWLFWRTYRRLARTNFIIVCVLFVLLIAVSDSTTSYFFKNLVQRLRPCKMEALKPHIENFGQGCGGKWGFFSSHSSNAAAIVHFMSAFALGRKSEFFLWWLFVLLVGVSRIYLGAHLPLDVIVGWLWGLSLASAWRWVARHSLKGPVAF